MIKFFVQITKVIITLAISFLFFSCGFEKINGNGKVVTQQRDTGNGFTNVTVSGGLNLFVKQDAKTLITVEADSNLLQHIKTRINGSTLIIETDKNIGNATSKKIMVSLPVIKGLESSSGSQLKATTLIKSHMLKIGSSSGSSLEVTIESDNTSCSSSSGSNLKIDGKTGNLKIESSSGSWIDAANLTTEEAEASASSGGSIVVNASKKLNASASSGGSVRYVATPDKLSKKESSGGNVSPQ